MDNQPEMSREKPFEDDPCENQDAVNELEQRLNDLAKDLRLITTRDYDTQAEAISYCYGIVAPFLADVRKAIVRADPPARVIVETINGLAQISDAICDACNGYILDDCACIWQASEDYVLPLIEWHKDQMKDTSAEAGL